MSNTDSVAESINAFSHVSPSETITVSLADLRQIITAAVQDAIEPLKDRIEALESIVASQGEKIASIESTQEHEISRVCVDIAYDRQRLAKLEKTTEEPTATESERIERIEKLCTDAPKHEISLSEIRGRLGIDKAVLSRLLKRIDADKFYLRKSTLDKRIRYLCFRPEVR